MAAALLAFVRSVWLGAVVALLALVVVLLSLGRVSGSWAYLHLRTRRRFRRRSASRTGEVRDQRLAGLAGLLPEVEVQEALDRSGARIAVLFDGRAWSTVIAVEPTGVVVGAEAADAGVPVELLRGVLDDPEQRVAAVQLVTVAVPSPAARLPVSEDPAAFSYASLLADADATGLVSHRGTWVALRLEPQRCPEAVERRGGGAEGARRTLLGATAQLVARLDAAGVATSALDAPAVVAALLEAAAAEGTSRETPGQDAVPTPPESGEERWDHWESGGVAHVSWAVRQFGRPGDASAQRLADVQATRASVVAHSVTFLPTETSEVLVRAFVRVAAPLPVLTDALAQVAATAGQAGIRLRRLDGAQAPAVLATLPLAPGGAS
ncbi:type VII secretion protein EccE [Motilibacter peucedani]|uniref:Type VII secretion protein EccE n=1 Tax=Motilibacter peucedani TaxID=598650 RepID=A0A420XN15_9ACTN|nr:type VII secretion protein EccE [Motilibacter peucedani]